EDRLARGVRPLRAPRAARDLDPPYPARVGPLARTPRRRAPGRRAARAGPPPPRGRRLRPRRPQHVVVLVHLHLAADVPDGGARALDRGFGLEDPGRRAGGAARLRLLRLGLGPLRTKAGLQPLRDPHGRGAGLDHAPLAGDRRVAAPPPPLPLAGRLR